LIKLCQSLDRENKGSITLDDFIQFSEQVHQEREEEEQTKAD
jgi:Ca2+-binding EF-hand superfamily protein